jgi:tetratricopeptide (TPR) repeat protein
MAFRFWRRIKIAPGVTLNLSKSGGSVSFGPRGAKFTVGPRSKRATVGIPGTGLFYTQTLPGRSRDGNANSSPTHATPSVSAVDRLTLGFFKRLVTPDDEKSLVDGCRELVMGRENQALHHFRQAAHLADGAYIAGFLSLKEERLDEAESYLTTAEKKHNDLGCYFSKYGISATMILPITDEISAHVGPNIRGVLLGLVEIHQLQERWRSAIACLKRLRRLEPNDVVVKLSLSELLTEAYQDDKKASQTIVKLSEGVVNETPAHAALMLYKAKALRGLGLPIAARDTLTAALRRKKDRSKELLAALRYERALVYEDLGRRSQARSAFEKLYAESPDYEDVATRLGL